MKPFICSTKSPTIPSETCGGALHITGADDVTINQGVGIDLTEGVTAYDSDGDEISYTYTPTEIEPCDVGEHEVTYVASGKDEHGQITVCGDNELHGNSMCEEGMTKVVRTVTITQANDPTIEGAESIILTAGSSVDLMDGVSGVDDNGNTVDVTFNGGEYDDVVEDDDIATFDTTLAYPLKSVEVGFEPVQECTPWIGTDTDNTPYLMRALSGLSIDVGNREYDKLIGGTIAWNQLVQNDDLWFIAMSGSGTHSYDSSTRTVTFTTTSVYDRVYRTQTYIGAHKYLVMCDAVSSIDGYLTVELSKGWVKKLVQLSADTSADVSVVIQPNQYVEDTSNRLQFYMQGTFDSYTLELTDVMLFDLTQMFGTTIADYIYTLEQATAGSGIAWIKSYGFFKKPYYAYNAGELMSVNVNAHKMIGFNQWDEEWELGYLNATTGENMTDVNSRRSKNYIPCLPNTTYYAKLDGYSGTNRIAYYDANKTFLGASPVGWFVFPNGEFTTPSNAYYFRFYLGSTTTYNNDICINISSDRNGEYEAYTENEYPIDPIDLRGILKLNGSDLYYDGDEYPSSGDVTRKYGYVDLGTLTWTYNANWESWYTDYIADIKGTSTGADIPNFVSDKFIAISTNNGLNSYSELGISSTTRGSSGCRLLVKNGSTSDTPTGQLVYEVYTSTTESASAYTSPQVVDAYGTEAYTDTRDVQMPVGHESSYGLVCPISGWDEITVTHSGKNLFDGFTNGYWDVTDGSFVSNNNWRASSKIKANVSTSYYISGGAINGYTLIWATDGTLSRTLSGSLGTIFTLSASEDTFAFYTSKANAEASTTWQIEEGSTATDYEAYNGTTYTESLGDTYYGGTLDLISGVLTVDRITMVFTPSDEFVLSVIGGNRFYASFTYDASKRPNNPSDGSCSHYDDFKSYASGSGHLNSDYSVAVYNGSGNFSEIYVRDSRFETADEINAYYHSEYENGTPLQVCYKLSEPIEVQLDARTLNAFKGTNNVWQDANGTVEVIFTKMTESEDVTFNVEGTYTVTYTTEDCCGNETTVTRTIYVQDTQYRFEGIEDTTIQQGDDFDPTDGITAYDANGNEIGYTVSPTEIDTCEAGTYIFTYTTGDLVETRTVTVEANADPTIYGVSETITVQEGEEFDPMDGVYALDYALHSLEVTCGFDSEALQNEDSIDIANNDGEVLYCIVPILQNEDSIDLSTDDGDVIYYE